jgi:hypothetical protein
MGETVPATTGGNEGVTGLQLWTAIGNQQNAVDKLLISVTPDRLRHPLEGAFLLLRTTVIYLLNTKMFQHGS